MTITEMVKECYDNSKAHGWHDSERTFGELIALCHSELSEALEEHRQGHLPTEEYTVCPECGGINCPFTHKQCKPLKPEGIPSELADVVIRIADMCGQYGIDLEKAIIEKHNYNRNRTYKHGNKVI